MRHKSLFATVPLLLLAACATMTVDKGRTAALKRVAIVGFSVEQPVPEGFTLGNLGGRKKTGMGGMPDWGSGLGHASPLADLIYQSLEKRLAKDQKWTLLNRNQVSHNGFYQGFHEQKMTGLQSRPPSASGTQRLAADGIVDAYPVEAADASKRRELIRKLGVDAIAVATVYIRVEKGGGLKQLVGAGDYYPSASVRFALFDTKSDEPVWSDLNAVGETVSEGVEHVFGITNNSALDTKMAAAAESSFAKLIARFRDNEG